MGSFKEYRDQLLLPVALLVLVAVTWMLLPANRPALTSLTLNIILVVGLSVFVTNTGIMSFGHVSFVAIGAYLAGLGSIPVATKHLLLPNLPSFLGERELPVLASSMLAATFAAILAVIVGVPLMRLSGVAASIATLSLLVITNVVLSNWDSLTGGTGTLTGVPAFTSFGVSFVVAVGSVGIAYLFFRSKVGWLLRATREDLVAAQSLGIKPLAPRLAALSLSAFIMAFGGALYGSYLGSFSPDAFYLQMTFLLLAMVVVGGQFTLGGVVAGACTITLITEVFRLLEAGVWVRGALVEVRPGIGGVVLAALVVFILTVRPEGLFGGTSQLPQLLRRVRKTAVGAP